MTRTLTFSETTSEISVTIEILGDNVLEDDKETFFVQLSSSDNAAVLGIGRATKEVCNDDTGKCSNWMFLSLIGSSKMLRCLYMCCFPTVEIDFTNASFSVCEGEGMVTVCAEVIEGESAAPLLISLATVSGTATGRYPPYSNLFLNVYTLHSLLLMSNGLSRPCTCVMKLVITHSHAMHPTTDPADFTGMALNRSVQSTGDEFCLTAIIVDDSNVEFCEEFSVSLSPAGTNINPGIIVTRAEIDVTILDNEGMECNYVQLLILVTLLKASPFLYIFRSKTRVHQQHS